MKRYLTRVFSNRYFRHTLFWMAYGTFWSWLTWGNAEEKSDIIEVIIVDVIYLLTHISATYISLYWLIPRFLKQRRYFLFSILFILDLLVFSAMIALGYYVVLRGKPDVIAFILRPEQIIPSTLFSTATTVMLLSAFKVLRDWLQTEKRNKQLSEEKLSAELSFLKSQINPHFLFNALNSIYFLIKNDPELAQQFTIRFSDMLRYQLYDCNDDKIPLKKEVEYIRNYIEIEKIRKGIDFQINVMDTIPDEVEVTPLVLFPFVENAIKFSPKNGKIDINISLKDKILEFYSKNEKNVNNSELFNLNDNHGGIGLQNIKRRLALLYPAKHDLLIEENHGSFVAYLKMELI